MTAPSKFTHETAAAIVAAVARGATNKAAAKMAGVDEATLYRWRQRPERRFRTFARRVEKARADYEAKCEAEWRRRQDVWLAQQTARSRAAAAAMLASVRR